MGAITLCGDVVGVFVSDACCGEELGTTLFDIDDAELIELGQAVANFDSIEPVSRVSKGNGAGAVALCRAAEEDLGTAETGLPAVGAVVDVDVSSSSSSRQRSAACHRFDVFGPVMISLPERRRSRLRRKCSNATCAGIVGCSLMNL